MRTAQEQGSGFQQILAGIVNLLLGFAYAEHMQTALEDMQVAAQLNEAKIIMQDNFNRNLSCQEVAARICMSYSRFRRLFRQYVGFAPAQYLLELKINKSKELLTNSALTCQEIAFESGFEYPSHFNIAFKKKTGITPNQYRDLTQGRLPRRFPIRSICKGAVRIVCNSPNRTCTPLSDEPEPRENARVLTLPGCRHLSKPSRRRCVRRSARLPGKAARSAAAQTLRFPTFADIRSGCTGRGTDRFRAAAFFDGKKTPIHRDRPARRTADSLHTFPLRDPLRLLSPKRKCERNFPRKGEAAGDRPKRRPPPAKRPAAVRVSGASLRPAGTERMPRFSVAEPKAPPIRDIFRPKATSLEYFP